MNDQQNVESDKNEGQSSPKKPYEAPVLKEHGDAKNITLQTFFGTFSPD